MLKRMGERVCHLRSHDALTQLCHSLAIPKLLLNLRTAPSFLSTVLSEYDSILQDFMVVQFPNNHTLELKTVYFTL